MDQSRREFLTAAPVAAVAAVTAAEAVAGQAAQAEPAGAVLYGIGPTGDFELVSNTPVHIKPLPVHFEGQPTPPSPDWVRADPFSFDFRHALRHGHQATLALVRARLRHLYAGKITACPQSEILDDQRLDELMRAKQAAVDCRKHYARVATPRYHLDLDEPGDYLPLDTRRTQKTLPAVHPMGPLEFRVPGGLHEDVFKAVIRRCLDDVVAEINKRSVLFCGLPDIQLRLDAYVVDVVAWCCYFKKDTGNA